ncbi:MAG: bacillithiol system redox-active protein YtxJ [Chitinophagaceae bacterium]|jgi:bacillithiol system protein YtxJ|nr:bacillithiol system redox-active protein YtxJ [Chitinophagaceae bacterium]
MEWKTLSGSEQIDQIIQESFLKPVAIFKHSTRCSISHMAKGRLERDLAPEGIDFYYLDLLNYRPLSTLLSEKFSVHHESPQILLIKNGECIYDESHSGIDMQGIVDEATA